MGLCVVEGKKSVVNTTAMVAATLQQCDDIDLHQVLGHLHEKITRETSKISSIVLTGDWAPCEESSKAKAHDHRVQKMTGTKATKKLERVEIESPYK